MQRSIFSHVKRLDRLMLCMLDTQLKSDKFAQRLNAAPPSNSLIGRVLGVSSMALWNH